nr:hypothetical protein [Tanacetum cinerariifolium]
MNPVAAKQVALDKSLVPSEKRLKNEKCNARIEFSKPQREETYQVTLDALKLSPCDPAFLITAEVPKMCTRLHNQAFVESHSEEELVTFIQELGFSGECTSGKSTGLDRLRESRSNLVGINLHTIRDDKLLDTLKFVSKTQDYQQYRALIHDDMINQDVKYSKAYKTYYDFATRKSTPKKASKFKKVASPSRKLSLVLKEEPAEKPKRAKKHAKKSTTVPTTCVVIRDTPSESVPKNKTPAKVDRGKGMDLLSMWHYLKLLSLRKLSRKASWKLISFMHVAQVMELVPNQRSLMSKKIRQLGDSGDDDDDDNDDNSDEVTKDDDEDDVESDTDDDKEASDSEKTNSYEDKNLKLNQNDDEEEEQEEKYVRTPDSFKFNNDDEEYEKLYKDVNTKNEQFKDDEHVTLITIPDTQNTKGPMQSSFVSSDFANQFINLDNVPPTNTEVISLMNVKVRHEEPSTHTTPLLNIPFTSSQPKSTYEAAASLTEFELKRILLDMIQKSKSYRDAQEHKDLYDALVKSYKLHKDLFKSYVKKIQVLVKTSSKSAQAEELVFKTANTEMPLNQREDLGNTDDQPNIEEALKDDWSKKPERPPTPDLDWNAIKSIDFRPPQT